MLNKKTFFIIIICIPITFILSCGDCHYTVTKDYIESNCDFDTGIFFEQIKVDSFDHEGVPVKYQAEELLSASLINRDLSTKKKIFFYQETENYNWNDIKHSSLHTTLPIIMKANNWYLIRGLMYIGNPRLQIFIHVDENGEYHFYHSSMITNW
jgi:hypothetical protein